MSHKNSTTKIHCKNTVFLLHSSEIIAERLKCDKNILLVYFIIIFRISSLSVVIQLLTQLKNAFSVLHSCADGIFILSFLSLSYPRFVKSLQLNLIKWMKSPKKKRKLQFAFSQRKRKNSYIIPIIVFVASFCFRFSFSASFLFCCFFLDFRFHILMPSFIPDFRAQPFELQKSTRKTIF